MQRRMGYKSEAQKIVDAARAKRRQVYVKGGQRAAGGRPQRMALNYRRLNTSSIKDTRVVRTIPYTATYGVNFSNISPAAAFTFDPSGTYGNTSVAGAGAMMPDWDKLIALYNFYKVNKITITFRYANVGTAIGAVPMWMRYNYEKAVTVPTLSGMTSLANCEEAYFTNDSPLYSYSFIPMVEHIVDNSAGILSSDARAIKRHDWTDVNYPATLYGFQCLCSYLLNATQTLFFEITYDVSFRYSK